MTARAAGRAYVRRFIPAMIAYVVLLVGAILLVNRFPAAWWRYPVMVVPLLPLLLVVRAVARLLVEADELQRRIQLEALAVAFGAGSVLTFGYGLLQAVGLPTVSWLWVWPVYAACWLVGSFLARRRY